jgi:archaellum component FlaF (FlaF/FlaG flagellin family)
MEFLMILSDSPCIRPVLWTAATVICLAAVCATAQAQFETRATSPFPEGTYSIATGDFNHDGKLDVVETTDAGFSVALGNGDGTFQNATTYSTKLSYYLAVADFNGDGNLDVVTADQDFPSTVSVYLGNGDRTFRTSPIVSSTTNANLFVAVGDFNGDGKPDVAVIDLPYISVLLGNGDGTFGPPSDNNSFQGAKWLAVTDFNNDRKADVLATGQFGSGYTIGVLLGNGDGTLQNSITVPLLYVPSTVAAGDLNRDGNMDAVLSDDLGGLAVFLGNGNGTLQPPVYYNTTGVSGEAVVVHDLNMDGNLDVVIGVVSATESGVDVFWGNGDGTLQPAQYFAAGTTGLVAVGDLNGDQLPDLVMGTSSFGVVTMLNTGAVNFLPTAPLKFPTRVINTKSPAQTVTLTNSGKSRLSISSIRVSGQFKGNDTCGESLAPGAECSISAWFQPTTTGSQTGLVTVIDGASSKPQVIELIGAGTAIKLSPGSLNFGTEKVGSKSKSQTVTATNVGSTAVQFSNVLIAGEEGEDFSQTNTCLTGPLEAGARSRPTTEQRTWALIGMAEALGHATARRHCL